MGVGVVVTVDNPIMDLILLKLNAGKACSRLSFSFFSKCSESAIKEKLKNYPDQIEAIVKMTFESGSMYVQS